MTFKDYDRQCTSVLWRKLWLESDITDNTDTLHEFIP